MKLFFVFLLMCFYASAQIKPVDQQYMQGENLLLNPGFEHGLTRWTFTNTAGAVLSAETNILISGKNSTKIVATGNAGEFGEFEFSQVSTLYASQLSSAQGVVSVWIKSSVSNAKVCSFVDGADDKCIFFTSNGNKWREYVIPFVFGSTSAGLKIYAGDSPGDIYIDSAYVGIMPATMMPEVSQAQIAVDAYIAGTASCDWSRTNTAIGAFTATSACPAPTLGIQNIGELSLTDTDLPRFPVNNLPAGKYKATFIAAVSGNGSNRNGLAINDGTSTCTAVGGITSSGVVSNTVVSCIFNYSSGGNRVFELYGASTGGALTVNNSNVNILNLKFILEYYPPKSKIYSQQCTSDLDCENVFSAQVSSTGVVSGENLDWINGNCTNANPSVCTFNTGVFTVTPNCTASPVVNGQLQVSGTTSTTVSLATQDSTGTSAAGAKVLKCQKSPPDYKQKNVITGTFANVVTTPNIAKPKTCYYAFGGASATLASPTNCAASPCVEVYDSCNAGTPPTRSGTGLYADLTFASGTWKANTFIDCHTQAYSTTSGSGPQSEQYFITGDQTIATSSTGGYVTNLFSATPSGAGLDSYMVLKCTADAP